MALTALDPNTALIVIDLQKGPLSRPTLRPLAEVVERAAALVGAFRSHALPVVLVNTTGTPVGRTETPRRLGDLPPGFADLLPELDRQPQDIVVTKQAMGAFTHTGLEGRLRDLGVTQVVVCGVATSLGVESTARQAYEFGFNVTLAVDAMTDISAEAQANSLERIFGRLGEAGTAADVIALLDGRTL